MNERRKPLILFDTDMDTDCDDAGALAILLSYVKWGRAELLGIVADAADSSAAGCCEAICNYYGVTCRIGTVRAKAYPASATDRYVRYRAHHDKTQATFMRWNRTVLFFRRDVWVCCNMMQWGNALIGRMEEHARIIN